MRGRFCQGSSTPHRPRFSSTSIPTHRRDGMCWVRGNRPVRISKWLCGSHARIPYRTFGILDEYLYGRQTHFDIGQVFSTYSTHTVLISTKKLRDWRDCLHSAYILHLKPTYRSHFCFVKGRYHKPLFWRYLAIAARTDASAASRRSTV